MLHIAIVNYAYQQVQPTASQWLDQMSTLTAWAEAVQATGCKVTVFQRFTYNEVVHRANVTYHFQADHFGPTLHVWQIPRQFHWGLRVLCAASVQVGYGMLVHINTLDFPLQTWHLCSLLPAACAVAVQHHGEQPWPLPQQVCQRWGFHQVHGFLFRDIQRAQAWQHNHIIQPSQTVYPAAPIAAATQRAKAGSQAFAAYEDMLGKLASAPPAVSRK